ncbi:MAG: TlpA family protein disulfide reductase [Deltaproteobacteria bacterium]|nr:TlpA family protein disulfide reductase [Deltaproteobacteria bacterium]
MPTLLRGIAAVVIFLAILAWVPSLFRNRTYHFESSSNSKQAPSTPVIMVPLTPSFSMLQPQAKKITLTELIANHGNVIINFWASWCPPCIEEMPSLEMLNRQMAAKKNGNLPLIVTISVDEDLDAIKTLFHTLDFKPSFIVLHDPQGQLPRQLGTTRFPETYWVNKEGRILHKWVGPQNWLSADILERLSRGTSS